MATSPSAYSSPRAVSPSLTTETKPWPCYSAAQTKPWPSCWPASTKPSTKLSSKTFTLTKSTRPLDISKLASVHLLPSWTLRIIHNSLVNTACSERLLSESRMREICLSGSMSGLCQEDERSSCCTKDEG